MTVGETQAALDGDVRSGRRPRPAPSAARSSGVYVAIALFAILPVVVFAIVTVRLSSDAIRDQVDHQIGASALASANVVEQHFGRLADMVEGTSERETFRAALETRAPQTMRSGLQSMIDMRSDVQLAFLADASGTLIDGLPETPEAIGQNFAFRDWYQGVSSTQQTYVSEAFETAAVGTPLSYVVVTPVYSPTDPDVVLGYMGVGQTLESLQDFVDEFAASQDLSLTITDQAGSIVSSPGETPTTITPLGDRAGFSAESIVIGEVRDSTWDGQPQLSVTATVQSYGWNVTAQASPDVALAPIGRITATAIVVGVMLSAMVLVGVGALARSLRRRREALERQARSEAFLTTIIDNIPSIVVVKDADTLCIERINPAGEAAFGSAPDELVCLDDIDVDYSPRAKARLAEERQILDSGRPSDVALDEFGTPSGVRQFRTRKIPIAPSGDVPGFLLCIWDDITENVEALAALQTAKSEAERANAAKSEFLSRMSHELRTPLNAVIGFGQLLEMDDPTDNQRESVEQILRGGRHLLGLINEVLDLARIETGHMSMSLEPIGIEGVVHEALDLVRPLAAEQGIDVPAVLPGDWSHSVFGDQQRIKQVIINLLANAIKYNRPDGRVDITCARHDDRLRINVADTGPGISDDDVTAMFSPFERLGAESSDVEGTGLGLSLSKSFIEAMGGAIGVDTEVGTGSTFWIDVDLAPSPSDIEPERIIDALPSTRIMGPAAQILYIEDNTSNIFLVERLVEQRDDLSILTATSGEEGIALAVEHLPDLILLDVNLPGIDGHDVLREFRDRPDTRHIPVIVLSADATPSQIDRFAENGVDRYLTKPIDVIELMATIDEELSAVPVG